jgi:hypothetical protein
MHHRLANPSLALVSSCWRSRQACKSTTPAGNKHTTLKVRGLKHHELSSVTESEPRWLLCHPSIARVICSYSNTSTINSLIPSIALAKGSELSTSAARVSFLLFLLRIFIFCRNLCCCNGRSSRSLSFLFLMFPFLLFLSWIGWIFDRKAHVDTHLLFCLPIAWCLVPRLLLDMFRSW